MKLLPISLSVLASVVLLLTSQPGCLGLMSNMMHAVGADMKPALYDGLKKTKLAIVTITDRSQYSEDPSARILTRGVSEILLREVKDLTVVREDEIQRWRDENGWDNVNFHDIGKGVGAEKVLGIEMTDLTLRDGATLYRGHANVIITVIDVASGAEVFRYELEDFNYPVNAGQYASETTEPRFRKLFLKTLATRIARTFHRYDFSDTVALDAAIASQ